MELKERSRPLDVSGPVPGGGSEGNTQSTRQAGGDFLSAADAAISRGLSTDSGAYLQSIQQQSGE